MESLNTNGPDKFMGRYEANRIKPSEDFAELYSEYKHDMERTENIGRVYNENAGESLGRKAEALVFSCLKENEISDFFRMCPTSAYDDYFHGADLLLEPRNSNIQSLAAIDITTNQEDVKGRSRINTEMGQARPVGFQEKIRKARDYTDRLASIDPKDARELEGWLKAGGLHEKRTDKNNNNFKQAEHLFLMKYYVSSEDAPEPNKPGYVIGGPRAVISIDTSFINKALQGDKKSMRVIGDLSVIEFASCVQEELFYLDSILKEHKVGNYFFDEHYTKVRAWVNVLTRPEIGDLLQEMADRNMSNPDFVKQIVLYRNSFHKLNQGR